MEPQLVNQQKLVIDINKKKFELHLPLEFKLTEGYEATMTMANIFIENMAKDKAAIEEKAAEVRPEEPKEEVEKSDV